MKDNGIHVRLSADAVLYIFSIASKILRVTNHLKLVDYGLELGTDSTYIQNL